MHILLKGACAALLAATATYALAHDGKHDTTQTVIVKEVLSDSGDVRTDAAPKCGAAPEVDVTDEQKAEGGRIKRSRVLICSDGREDANVVHHLEEARGRITAQAELSDEARAKALAAIDDAIARHKGAAN